MESVVYILEDRDINCSFSYLAPKIWNDIPLEIRLSDTLPTFKRRLKTYLFK